MLRFFILGVLLFILFQVQKNQGPNERYTVTFSFSPFIYDFIKALAVAVIVAILTN